MKVDTSKLKKGSSDLTPECRLLIEQMTKCRTRSENLEFLEKIQVWVYGKCELYHWIEILDRFDQILEEAACHINGNEFVLYCDTSFSAEDTRLLLHVLNFTTLLIEHSFSRHLYNSIEHLTQLLSSQNMDIVLAVLNLLYMFSKRSNFIPRLSFEKKETLLIKLLNIAERWGDPNYGLALIDCCMNKPKLEFLYQLFIEYMDDNGQIALLDIPDMMDICNSLTPSEVVQIICDQMSNPSDAVKMRIAHRARLISGFKNSKLRLQFVQARLQAVSVLIYSNALQENTDKVLYPGFGEELCELIDKEDVHLVDIRAAVLRTLTSMLHFDRNHNVPKPGSRLPKIIHYTGAERQGGILPLLVRDCISSLTGSGTTDKYPLSLATSLFSLLYHLASYEAGGQALVKSGMMQSLLRVINWPGVDLEHITFVTRAVRVIDLITNIDIAKFHQNNGLNAFIDRLEKEVNNCRTAIQNGEDTSPSESVVQNENLINDEANKIQDASSRRNSTDSDVILIDGTNEESSDEIATNSNAFMYNDNTASTGNEIQTGSTSDIYPVNSYYARPLNERNAEQALISESQQQKKITCVTQRAALLKSMLNFLKKSIQDHAHFNGMRNIMETSLPCSLRHIISNAEYYGPSLFLLATDVVTVYVFNEPSLLSSLQDSGITNVMLQSLLQKEVPATREVLGSLPNVFSALCLNERGLMEFMSYDPFDKLLKVLLSPDYLVAMRRRRSSDPLGDTATNLGNAMDDLMKHHPYLRTDATEAIVRLLNELVRLGTDSNFICWRANKDNSNSVSVSNSGTNIIASAISQQQTFNNTNSTTVGRNNENDSSGEDDDDDEEMSSASQQQQQRQNRPNVAQQVQQTRNNIQEREPIPLIDYILNVMKFIEATFSNSSNGDHCREFVLHGGLKPLLKLLSLPNLPVDSPVSTTAQAVANVCKSILNLAHETKVIDTALQQLSHIVSNLHPLIKHASLPGGSVLLRELLTCPKLEDGFSNADYTPLLHNMSSVHGYVVMLVHICRNASTEMRSILLKRWGSNNNAGLELLQNLVQLYISLVWESTVLLSLCSDDPIAQSNDSYWDEIANLQQNAKEVFELHNKKESNVAVPGSDPRKLEKGVSVKSKIKPEDQLRYIKSLLAASSRLGRALAELFGTLVKLSVGTPQSRQRRNNDYLASLANSKFPSADAREIARVLSSILVNGFCHESLMPKPAAKLKLTFLICSVGFTGPMLFDDKRSCFHLMISQFCEENGLQAFFDMFYWALSIGNEDAYSKFSFENCTQIEQLLENREDDVLDFPEGTGEFLDAWLQLLEKMVNPLAILNSPYALATSRQPQSSGSLNFEPIFYLIQVHQLAMVAVKRIWKRKPIPNYGVSMTETIMAILKHLINSNSMLCERFQLRLHEFNGDQKLSDQNKNPEDVTRDEASVNSDHLKILTDMGFLKQHVLEALHNTHSLEQATDYLLNNPEACGSTSREPSTSANASNSYNDMDIDVSALASTTTGANVPSNLTQQHLRKRKLFSDLKLISTETFNAFCFDTLERTFSFMEFLPETVNTGADLLSVLYRRQKPPEKTKYLQNLVQNITEWTEYVLRNMKLNFTLEDCKQEELITGMTATKLFIRLKVATLLLDEMYSDMRKEFCVALCKDNTLNALIKLLNKTKLILQEQVTLDVKPIMPRWLQSLVDLMDAIDSVSLIMQRKVNMRAVCSDSWKWYDTSTGKWNMYSEANNALIKSAFTAGERSVVINIGRQRYTINFNCMTQVSEASGSHRPVMPALKITEAIAMLSNENSNTKIDNILTRIIKKDNGDNTISQEDVEISLSSLLNFTEHETLSEDNEGPKKDLEGDEACMNDNYIPSGDIPKTTKSNELNSKKKYDQTILLYDEPTGLSKYDTTEIITCLVSLLNPNLILNFETKLSLLKLCARLTKNYENAIVFVKEGGIELLLKMQQSCGLMGFPTYAIIIIRHVLEAPSVLQESIERVLTSRTAQPVPIGNRDLLFVLTQVSSAVARHPKIFLEAAKKILRGDYITNPTFTIDDSKFLVKAQTNTRKNGNMSCAENIEENQKLNNISIKVIKELLYAIVQPCVHYGGIQVNVHQEHNQLDQNSRNEELLENLSTSVSNKSLEKYESCCCSWHIPSSGHNHQKPVLPRATIIKILADAVRSYQSLVPGIIIGHNYTSDDSILIEKEQSCLSFILDNFLPIVRRQQDTDVSVMSRVLISSIVDCYGNAFVQSKVAEEVHEAIVRALSLPESTEKHTRLQVLIGLLPMMIESPMLVNKINVQRNNMYRILLRQGIMTDLSKIAQYNDLSNSNTFSTIFSILRPMEILLRLTVAPGTLSSKRILFGNAAQGGNSISNRRFYPRLTSRSNSSTSSATIGGDNVLRDIIRNVLSDRRHGFEFIFNPEDLIVDSEDNNHSATLNADDDGEDNDGNNGSAANSHGNIRSQLNFDRLLDDFMQNERDFQNLRLINRNTNSNNGATANAGVSVPDHHRHSGNNSEADNNDNGAGGSDGASTSSETAAAAVGNVGLGDVTTSDSNDSDSNVSTENEDRNDDDDDDDDDDDGNEEGAEDPSEADADDETRQFIEVFDHIYEHESSETASNEADVDADDEASEVGGRVNGSTGAQSASMNTIGSEAHITNEEQGHEESAMVSSEHLAISLISSATEPTNNSQQTVSRIDGNETSNSVRTTPTSAWIAPRMAVIGTDGHMSYDTGLEFNSNISNDISSSINNTNDRSENSVTPASASLQSNSTVNNSQNIATNMQRREPTRRLVFLDQQYCTPMPSFSNPTEEGQIELFNQDALHWWLEEAKHLDFESQTDSCLYVAHLLVPFLIKELKKTHLIKKKSETPNPSIIPPSTANRRSAIPVLIQQSNNSVVPNMVNTATITNSRHTAGSATAQSFEETPQFRVPQSLREPRITSSQRLDNTNENVPLIGNNESDSNVSPEVFVFSSSDSGQVPATESDEIANVSATENSLNETLEISAINQSIEGENDDVINDSVIEDEADNDDDDGVEDDEMNTTFIEDDDLNSTFNVDFDSEIQNVLSQPSSEIRRQSTTENTYSNENHETHSEAEVSNPIEGVDVNQSAVNNNADEGFSLETTNDTTTNNAETASVVDSTNNSEMSPEVRAALGGLEVPEGVDPSFLAALPVEMREEVIQEHLRMQRVRQRAQQNALQVAHDSLLEVNPEFLAALPPNIQSEVLMQQRIEQQRQAAQSANPDDPVDAGAFFQNLPDSLRQAILTDMDESQIASLPPELAAEAQYLRRDWESRNGARLDVNQANTLSASRRGGYLTARFPSSLQNRTEDFRWHTNSIWYDANGIPQSQHHHHTTIVHQHHQQLHGKPIALLLMEDENKLLDPDSLTTLLLFLFIEDSKMNFTRLHRVVRNLCYHLPTREWIINALISIIQRTNKEKMIYPVKKLIKPQWLKLRIDAAFGYKSNVFFINKLNDEFDNENGSLSNLYSININPQAAQMIVRNCLDLLFVLAKHFPKSFLPYNRENKSNGQANDPTENVTTINESTEHISSGAAVPTDNTSILLENDVSSVESRPIFPNQQRFTNLNLQRPQIHKRQIDGKNIEECPSTSKAAAAVRQKGSKNVKVLQYNTNAKQFWDVLLNVDVNTHQRLSNIQGFPINSQPSWEWELKNPDFLSFNDSPFAKLLEMLPYKVICRSPQLTDMLIKLLASLSVELPKEEECIEKNNMENTTQPEENNSNFPRDIHGNPKVNENDTSSDDDDKSDALKNQTSSKLKSKRKMYSKNFSQLQLIIEVLTHQCGTTDGLDNISKLIFHLSLCSEASNAIFLQYLTAAILGLAQEVKQSIQTLLDELRSFNSAVNHCNSTTSGNTWPHVQGIMQDRFTSENVIISASTNMKPSYELQLPAMKKLLSTTSAQPYFLRTLKIFMQIRDLFETHQTTDNTSTASNHKPTLSQIICLDDLWNTLSECLVALEDSKDEYAVLVLQPTVEAFFLIHASDKNNSNKNQTSNLPPHPNLNENQSDDHVEPVVMDLENASTSSFQNTIDENTTEKQLFKNPENSTGNLRDAQLKLDRIKFLSFAEKHRTVLNQILRQSPTHLSDGPFAVLVDHTRILDFDVKRKYFQTELERNDQGVRREENTVSVRRVTVFEDSFRVLYRLGPEEWKNRFYIVFEDEEGQDAGGLLREWYVIISREIFNPMYALFCVSPGDRVTYMINPSSHANPNHLSYFKFVGRVIAKAIHDNKLLECYFTRSFYKHILGKQVKYTDMESQDYEFYKGLDYLMKNDISTLGYELTFSTEVQEFGVTQVRDLIPNGRDIAVTEENKFEYVQLVCQLKMSGSIRQQLDAFLEGFYDIIPKHLISIFNEQELELLISGLPDIDIEDLKTNTEYHKYTSKSVQIQWFWRALRSFDQADRAKFLQFVTGTSKVPLQGFRSLEGMNGIQKFQIHRDDRSTDRLPCAHTCFNQLDLPMYKSYDKLRSCLLKAIHECSEGFGFA